MQREKLSHKTDINKTKPKNSKQQIPITNTLPHYISYNYNCLYYHIARRYYYMRNFQFIRHNLIQMFAMWQPDILMKHQTMNNSQYTIHTINGQKDYPAEIFCFNNEPAYQEKKDEGNAHGTHITSKALGFLAEIEEAEDKNGTNNGIDEIRFHKSNHLFIDISQRSKNNQRVAAGYTVNAIHKVVGIDNTRTDYQGYDYPPPRQGEKSPLIKHQDHGGEMKKQPCHLSGGFYVIHKTDERHQCQGKQEPEIFKATRQEISQRPEIEDNPTTAQSHFRMRTALIGLVNDIAPISHPKI